MLRGMMVIAMLAATLCAPAYAQYRHGNEGRVWAQQAPQRYEPRERPEQRQREAQRRDNGDDRRRALTPEERRELNRDLQRANREIYRKKGREK